MVVLARNLYVLADGGRARFVKRAPETGAFVTFEELRGHLEPAGRPPGLSFQSGTPQRHSPGREDPLRRAKEAFMATVAERAAQICASQPFQKVWIVAPGRLAGALRNRLAERHVEVVVLQRDLTKTPDSDLPRWLAHLAPA